MTQLRLSVVASVRTGGLEYSGDAMSPRPIASYPLHLRAPQHIPLGHNFVFPFSFVLFCVRGHISGLWLYHLPLWMVLPPESPYLPCPRRSVARRGEADRPGQLLTTIVVIAASVVEVSTPERQGSHAAGSFALIPADYLA